MKILIVAALLGALPLSNAMCATLGAPRGDVVLTVGVCDLEAAGDALALYAFADRALARFRRRKCAAFPAKPKTS